MNDKRCWTRIDLGQLRKNLEIYKNNMRPGSDIMAVVKADAYGHGDAVVAGCLYDAGVRHFAVSNIDEALHIRRAGVAGHILILGYTPPDRFRDLVEHDISQTLLSEEYAAVAASTGVPVRCQFALDTGMRRIGLNADDPAGCERVIRQYAPLLEGLFTHLCAADTPQEDAFTQEQLRKFEIICERTADLRLPYCHAMNSAGGLWHQSDHSRMTRLGIILYGLKPDYMNTLPEGIAPVMEWRSVVSMVKTVCPGDTIGYGRSFRAERAMRVATIPTGYADGYSRLLSNRGYVLINGKKARIVGRVCMDQMMADVTDIPDAALGTEVVLLGRSGDECITADDLALMYGTIGYEVICGISKRVDRVYIGV